ncbi:hypothetical protein FHU33_3900 [Blastococcus colisei]|uniref:Uncharacterized protein n=1 Tax=Blastococcus colisei TaxID=1564162 RepID=A0A543PJY7_9ACTN|nr:hypothetical protein [Blastococcus colisei]TQN44398.1 hypothetical protein FHU33_3900 [Blastococcus colisei]
MNGDLGLDNAVAYAFGRTTGQTKSQESSSGGWRTGPPGVMTESEFTARFGASLPLMHTHVQWQEAQRRRAAVEETDRQIAEEQRLLRLAADHGWDWVRSNTTGEVAKVAESVRSRLPGSTGAELRESAGSALLDAGLRVRLQETTTVRPKPLTGRKIEVTIISPGMGSSGLYTADVLEAAARDKVFPRGLALFLDHPTSQEQRDRPERSVRDLAGRLTTDARWTGAALVAEAEVLPTHAALIAALEGIAGMSIRAQGDVEMADVDGHRVRKITRLMAAESVDFVTRAGRGGSFRVLESERPRWGS